MNDKKYLLVFLICLLSNLCKAQPGADTLPYRKYPTLPAFNILLTDSATIFNTYKIPEGKPIVLMYFSPDCDHCRHLTEKMLEHINELKKARIYMFSMMTLSSIREFEESLKLKDYHNILVGREYDWFFPKFYGAQYLPYIVIYDKHKKLARAFEGGAKVEDIISEVDKAEK